MLFAVVVAAVSFASCGSKTTAEAPAPEVEETVIEEVVAPVDSIVTDSVQVVEEIIAE